MDVLLVDDEAIFASSVHRTFDGVRVHTATDLPEALRIASGHAIDLVLLDLAHRTCDGVKAVERFHDAFPEVPIVVLSAADDTDRIRACLEAGADGYVPKRIAVVALSEAMKIVAKGGLYLPPPRRVIH
jgi:two-component system response regulator DegU